MSYPKKIKSEPGLSISQSENQIEFYKKGFLNLSFNNKESLENLLQFLNKEVIKFNNGDRKYWKQTFGGAYDMVKDELFVDFIKKNQLTDIVNSVTNQEYVLGDAKFRMWSPGDGYLKWHRDTYIFGNKVVGKIPPDINLFFYPHFNEKSTPQLKIINMSHRIDFQNNFLNKLQILFGEKKVIYSNNTDYFLFNSVLLHGLPTHGKFLPTRIQRLFNKLTDKYISKKKYYPRLILRFCAKNNSINYNRGTGYNDKKLDFLEV